MVVLVGQSTKNLYKFVRWEMEVALQLKIPITVINLNKKTDFDNVLCPPILRSELVLHINFTQKAITWAIDNWIKHHNDLIKKKEIGPRILDAEFYKQK